MIYLLKIAYIDYINAMHLKQNRLYAQKTAKKRYRFICIIYVDFINNKLLCIFIIRYKIGVITILKS